MVADLSAVYGSTYNHRHDAFLAPLIADKAASPSDTTDAIDDNEPTSPSARQLILQDTVGGPDSVHPLGQVRNVLVEDLERVQGYTRLTETALFSEACSEPVRQSLNTSKPGDIVKFYIFTEAESASPTVERSIPLFKWTQQHSSYGRMTGAWGLSVGATIRDGAWRGGRSFKLLLRYVDHQDLEELQSAWNQGDRVML